MNGRNAALAVLGVGAVVLLLPGLASATSGSGVNVQIPTALPQWADLAQKYAQINPILGPEEILAIIWNESSGNPNATNPGDPSWGLMGVTMLIGAAYAGVTDPSQLLDPETNVKAGSAFLAKLKNEYSGSNPNDWPDAYNVGETAFNKGVRSPTSPTYSQAFFAKMNVLVQAGL